MLQQAEEINGKYGTSIHTTYLKDQLKDYISKMEGSLASKVNQRIQISDLECSTLLKLEGTIREEEIDSYIKKIIKDGMDKYISELEYELNKTSELSEHAIKEKLDQKENEINKLLADINNAKYIKAIEEKEKK